MVADAAAQDVVTAEATRRAGGEQFRGAAQTQMSLVQLAMMCRWARSSPVQDASAVALRGRARHPVEAWSSCGQDAVRVVKALKLIDADQQLMD